MIHNSRHINIDRAIAIDVFLRANHTLVRYRSVMQPMSICTERSFIISGEIQRKAMRCDSLDEAAPRTFLVIG